MIPKSSYHLSSLFPIFLCFYLRTSLAQPSTIGYPCTASNSTSNTCHTYVYYRAQSPDFLDLASIGDLFSVSRLMISEPSNISSPSSPLIPDQSLLVPISCGCNFVNESLSLSFANLTYTIKKGDTFYIISTVSFENLTTYQSVEVLNPTLIPTNLTIGVNVIFPLFCKCPNKTQLRNAVNFLISYVFQPSDNLSSVAAKFGTTRESIVDVSGNNIKPFDTVFVPVSKLPHLNQPTNVAPVSSGKTERKGAIIGLGIGLGICVLLLALVVGFWSYREAWFKRTREDVEERRLQHLGKGTKRYVKDFDVDLLADVSGTLDKYRLYEIEELRAATDGFDKNFLIQGSVYKGCIDGQTYAIKKMKWNAQEELKILQKVNHGNLVKLEGFCIDPENATCYLVYEYIENGSLHSWLHESNRGKLNWKTRVRIAVDVANGLQYIHEHTRPQVVHKDIKSSNILLDSKMRAKIANFGLAKSGFNAITMHIVGTQGYMAPEYIADGVVSTKLDVFSFGVVLLELISGREAIDEEGRVLWMSADRVLDGNEETKLKNLMEWMDESLLDDSFSVEGMRNIMAVAVACVSTNPSRRPGMVDIVYSLSKSDDLFYDLSEDGIPPEVDAR
ncbi:hypothetical protein Nepgr_021820 [Nepenthes gracilis]|uniref:Protein kinase domain-containing protein n=1 Tax=Nepenthes gracilis TaxID=150966 RepID=A0AAD3XXF2_NEPGR|nr:hypothetical protein Nepgr_021820 [Nepenthes gracilis]